MTADLKRPSCRLSGQVFISYRRNDAAAEAERLCDRLSTYFPKSHIFMDFDSIKPGADFVKAIETSVGSCDVLIAVIGKGWLTAYDKEGKLRLDDPKDIVRREIATALKRDIPVIPVLVDASMPQSSDLPEDLKALVHRNSLEINNTRFRADSERIISAVEHALERPRPPGWKKWACLLAGVLVVLVATILLYKGLQPVRITPTPFPPSEDLMATTALHVVELGLDVAFINSQQSQSMAGALPPGAQVMKLESSGAAARAGIDAGDIIEAIGSQKIDTLDDLRKSFRELGPGKTQFTISRSGVRKTIVVDCPNC
jgi:membrane-associated protease RseP (regulator of RpoE activity)